ncbi:hypothetical protein GCM10022393_29120 [Aquimarina addita]|uniref:Uncharacterized protein n=1 Tax=Aquimarina addita TaxID=870485 RepID=A0ABP6UQS4_9FLAO
MKLKIMIAFFICCVSTLSYGQDYKSYTEVVKNIDTKIDQGSYSADTSISADKLIIETPEQNIAEENEDFFSEDEWRKIKNQIKKNKDKITNLGNNMYSSKTLDTIFLYISDTDTKTKLSCNN